MNQVSSVDRVIERVIIDIDDSIQSTVIHLTDVLTKKRLEIPVFPEVCKHYFHCVDVNTSLELNLKHINTTPTRCPACGIDIKDSLYRVSLPMQRILNSVPKDIDLVYANGHSIYINADDVKNEQMAVIRFNDTDDPVDTIEQLHKSVTYYVPQSRRKRSINIQPTPGITSIPTDQLTLGSPSATSIRNALNVVQNMQHTQRRVTSAPREKKQYPKVQLRHATSCIQKDKTTMRDRIRHYEKKMGEDTPYKDTYTSISDFWNDTLREYENRFGSLFSDDHK
jgi:hypothetical protein